MVGPRKPPALAEESAEVEVLFANMDKMKTLTKKIQASVNRLDASGKAVQDAISPIYGNTQKLQIATSNIDRVIEAIERLRAPRDQSEREERIIRAGYVHTSQIGVLELTLVDPDVATFATTSHRSIEPQWHSPT